MNPEDTDKYRRFEDLMFRLTHPKRHGGEEESEDSSKTLQLEKKPSEDPGEEPRKTDR